MKLGVFATHPVQYHVPLWRGLAADPALDARVFYFSDQGASARLDPGFGEVFKWDLPLLEGYNHAFLTKQPIEEVARVTIPDIDSFLSAESFDAILLHGYTHRFARQLVRRKRQFGFRVLLRCEFSDKAGTRRSHVKRAMREIYLRWFYARVDHFCPIGSAALEHLRLRGIPNDRMTLTRYSVDESLIETQKANTCRNAARQALGISPDKIVFLFSGKLIPRKQPVLLAKAAESFAADPRFVLCYVGSGEQRGEIEKILSSCLGSRLIMPGFVNQGELGRYFAAADVFVLPSAHETWGLVVNESMHWGLPCIASDMTGCHRDLIREGVTGFVHRWNDIDGLRAAMRKFLDDPGLSRRMGESAAREIEPYRSTHTVTALREAVQKLLSQR